MLISLFFSSFCQGLAVDCDCYTPWTFLLIFFQAFEPMFSEQGTSLRKVYLPRERTDRPSQSNQRTRSETETSFYAVLDRERDVSIYSFKRFMYLRNCVHTSMNCVHTSMNCVNVRKMRFISDIIFTLFRNTFHQLE